MSYFMYPHMANKKIYKSTKVEPMFKASAAICRWISSKSPFRSFGRFAIHIPSGNLIAIDNGDLPIEHGDFP